MKVFDRSVCKYSTIETGVSKLHFQALYMQHLNDNGTLPICPRVLKLSQRGYFMEKCLTVGQMYPGLKASRFLWLLEQTFDRLQWSVWSKPPVYRDISCYLSHLERNISYTLESRPMLTSARLRGRVKKLIASLGDMTFPTVRVHGDATLDNVLFGITEDEKNLLLVSDPLKPDDRIPSYRVVDAGKLLQSAHGWENFKYPRIWPPCDYHEARSVVLDKLSSRDERCAALVWCVIHCCRIIPYAERQPQLTERIVEMIQRSVRAAEEYQARELAT